MLKKPQVSIDTKKRNALAKLLGVKRNEVDQSTYDDCTFEADGAEYRVYTDDEAEEACTDYIKESLWAFNADFLSGYTRINSIVFERLSELCEGANDAVLSIINACGGLDGFAKKAISADGRGHFLSSYDGDEIECGNFYAYRTN